MVWVLRMNVEKYLEPLIQGEAYPPYYHGLPQYVKLKNNLEAKKLSIFKKVKQSTITKKPAFACFITNIIYR